MLVSDEEQRELALRYAGHGMGRLLSTRKWRKRVGEGNVDYLRRLRAELNRIKALKYQRENRQQVVEN